MDTKQKPEVAFHVSDDKMTVTVDCPVSLEDLESLKESILKKLRRLGIVEAAMPKDLEAWLRAAAADSPKVKGAVLYEGRRPVSPRHGSIEWAGDFFRKGFAVDSKTGAIDFRRRVAQLSIKEGQLLAKVIPPVGGQDGQDVFGRLVRTVKAKKASIRAGTKVRCEDKNSFYAASSGRIRWQGGVLSVDEVYTVRSDIGLKTGHISHPGALEVRGDICEGSLVEADGDIDVRGIIEGANVRAGGHLTVYGGIIGAEGSTIEAGGSVHTRYILEADLRAEDDIIVQREIVNSKVKTRGAISIPRGRIVGGELEALGGIEAGQTGSGGNVETLLVVGTDFVLSKTLEEREKKLADLDQTRARIREKIDPLIGHAEGLPHAKLQAIKKLSDQVEEIERAIMALRVEIYEAREDSQERAKPEVIIKVRAYPETIFCIEEGRFHLHDERKGPLKAVFKEGQVELI